MYNQLYANNLNFWQKAEILQNGKISIRFILMYVTLKIQYLSQTKIIQNCGICGLLISNKISTKVFYEFMIKTFLLVRLISILLHLTIKTFVNNTITTNISKSPFRN